MTASASARNKEPIRMQKCVLLLLVVLTLPACATKLSLATSPPGAEIFDGTKLIGKTPLEITENSFAKQNANGFLLRIEKDGYRTIWFWLPKSVARLSTIVNLQPFRKAEESATRSSLPRSELNSISMELLSAQSSLLLDESLDTKLVAKAAEGRSDLGAVHYLAALQLLREKKGQQALENLEKAVKLSPLEPEYESLLNQIKTAKPD